MTDEITFEMTDHPTLSGSLAGQPKGTVKMPTKPKAKPHTSAPDVEGLRELLAKATNANVPGPCESTVEPISMVVAREKFLVAAAALLDAHARLTAECEAMRKVEATPELFEHLHDVLIGIIPTRRIWRYTDPVTGSAVWRRSDNTWNGQHATDSMPLYSVEQIKVAVARAARRALESQSK